LQSSLTCPTHQWRRQGGRGKLPPYGWTSKNYVICVCAFIVMQLLRITRQIHCKAIEQRATLIHRQYNGDWGTSYSRPPIDPYLTSPCYKILAALLQHTERRMHAHRRRNIGNNRPHIMLRKATFFFFFSGVLHGGVLPCRRYVARACGYWPFSRLTGSRC